MLHRWTYEEMNEAQNYTNGWFYGLVKGEKGICEIYPGWGLSGGSGYAILKWRELLPPKEDYDSTLDWVKGVSWTIWRVTKDLTTYKPR